MDWWVARLQRTTKKALGHELQGTCMELSEQCLAVSEA
jgi:hypothetical protein